VDPHHRSPWARAIDSDPTRLKIADLSETHTDPLSLESSGANYGREILEHVKVVFSEGTARHADRG